MAIQAASYFLIVGSYPCAGFSVHARWNRVSWVPLQGVWHSVDLSPDALKNAGLCKTLFYCAVSAPLLFVERVWHAYRETEALGEAVLEAWTRMDRNVVLAKVIIVGLVFAC